MTGDTQEEAARREESMVKEIQRLEEEVVEEQVRLERRLSAALEDKKRAVKEVPNHPHHPTVGSSELTGGS